MSQKFLIEITPTIFVTRQVWYNKNYNKLFKNDLSKFIKDVEKIENELGLYNHKFILCAIRHTKTLGKTQPNILCSKIDPRRQSYKELLETFVHEGIHLQQSITGQIVWERFEQQYYWEGLAFGRHKASAIKYSKYKELPWEVDAHTKSPIIYKKLFGGKYPKVRKKAK
jgi:hypothetical protein